MTEWKTPDGKVVKPWGNTNHVRFSDGRPETIGGWYETAAFDPDKSESILPLMSSETVLLGKRRVALAGWKAVLLNGLARVLGARIVACHPRDIGEHGSFMSDNWH